MVGLRDQPPSIQDGRYGLDLDGSANMPRSGAVDFSDDEAEQLARQAYESSTSWLNSGRRARWNDNLRAFQNLHPQGSKYLSAEYRARTRLYRPKTRVMVRKSEAQTAAAFFSNEDVVSIQAEDDTDPKQIASAALLQALLQYRLTKTIPWFLTLVGARQDAEVMGICCAKAYWEYEEKFSHTEDRPVADPLTGEHHVGVDGAPTMHPVDVMTKSKDRPRCDLLAPENIRFEPGADWRNVVETSPYIIEMIPMYLQDVQKHIDDGEWLDVQESALRGATTLDDDQTRRSREQGRVPGLESSGWKPRPFDIVWVRANTIRCKGEEWYYYTLGNSGTLLTRPRPLSEVFLHGQRPYVIGFTVLETHKTYPTAKVELVDDLQRAANEDWNLRFDNIKMALQPRQFVKAGSGVEIADLLNFRPGKTVIVNTKQSEPISNVVQWDRPPDVTSSAYAEQDRINLDFDEMTGEFSNSSVQASQIQQQSATGMNLMSGQASGMNEYELRVFVETFVDPLVRLLVKLEQAYETDATILAMAGRNAQLIEKFGIDAVTDDLLQQELTTRVNVGIGSTNPQMKLRNLEQGAGMLGKIFGPALAPGLNFDEVVKEVMGLCGYKDGGRFFKPGYDPGPALQGAHAGKGQPAPTGGGANPGADQAKLQSAQIQAQSRLQERQIQAQSDLQIAQIEARTSQLDNEAETYRAQLQAQHDADQAHRDREQEAAESLLRHTAHLRQPPQQHPALAGLMGG